MFGAKSLTELNWKILSVLLAFALLSTCSLLEGRAEESGSSRIAGCYHETVPGAEETLLHSFQTPDVCQSGLCKVFVSWNGSGLGASDPGLTWPVTLYQSAQGEWVAGPALTIGKYSSTDGQGTNGDRNEEAVIGGGKTSNGNSIRVYDDYKGEETDPDKWTIRVDNSHYGDQLEDVHIYVCTASRTRLRSDECEHRVISEDDEWSSIKLPELCQSGICRTWISWEGARIGIFKPGLSFPTTFHQEGGGDWLSGPSFTLGGFATTTGSGFNSNNSDEDVIGGGESPAGNSVALFDDRPGVETDSRHWAFKLVNPSSQSKIANPQIFISKLAGLSADWKSSVITTMSNETGTYRINAKQCRGTFCEVWLYWENTPVGFFGDGFSWPVTIYQKTDGSWRAGPAVKIGGWLTSTGVGKNGDDREEALIGGGETPSGNYLKIIDDYPGTETNPNEWTLKLENSNNEGRFNNVKVYILPRNLVPLPKFNYSPTQPKVNQAVSFDASDSIDKLGKINRYRWFFGDGEVSSGEDLSHKYTKPGTYEVRLTVIDGQGGKNSVTKDLTVRERKPKLMVNVVSDSGRKLSAGIYLNGSREGNSGSDGEYILTDLSSGSYKVRARKEGFNASEISIKLLPGEQKEITLTLEKKNKPPDVSFIYSPRDPKSNQEITFKSNSADPDGTVKQYSWDLNGDGSRESSGPKVSQTYSKPGTYKVKLTVTDDDGATTSTSQKITVKQTQPDQIKIEDKYGLVIGISNYKYETITELRYPAQDAKDFYQFLTTDSYESFPEENVTLLTDEGATTQAISKQMSQLVAQIDNNDLVIIYYSGHGAPGPDFNNDEEDEYDEYYITYDTNTSSGANLYSTGITDDEFGNWLTSMDSKQVAIFLDSCYSGGATKAAKGTSIPGQKAIPKNEVFNDFSFDNRLLFAASSENQPSWESPELNQGVFTHFLLKGLKGKADTNDDGKVIADELYDYLKPKVSDYVEEHFTSTQTPLMKGAISAPLSEEKKVLEGEVKHVKKAGKDQATKGDYVVINLGAGDGVKKGDTFKVFYTAKGVGVFEKIQGKIRVTDVIGSDLAVCKIIKSDFTVESGYKVKKIDEELDNIS